MQRLVVNAPPCALLHHETAGCCLNPADNLYYIIVTHSEGESAAGRDQKFFPARRFKRTHVRDFWNARGAGCRKAGCPGMLRNNFRCTPVRNMVNWGVQDHVTITVTEYRTRCVFDRYHIVSPGDLQGAARRLADTSRWPTIPLRG